MNRKIKTCGMSMIAFSFAAALTGCQSQQQAAENFVQQENENEETADRDLSANLSFWSFQIGSWADESAVQQVIAKFNQKYPNIHVTFQPLSYDDGDALISDAVSSGQAPDVVLEGPERLVSNWGDHGYLVNLNDMWSDDVVSDVVANNTAVLAACIGSDGNYYEYPLCMNTHCMAVNQELFEASGAMQYIDQETRTWTTDGFEQALRALKAYGVGTTGIVYCGGQGGDQGTRALAMNLYSAQFTNGTHTQWTMDSDAGIRGVRQLVTWVGEGLLTADPEIVAADELKKFAAGEAAMTFCWNASNRANYAAEIDFTPYAVAFPSDDGVPELAGGLPGFCVFDHQDADRARAAKLFISYICDDPEQAAQSVRMSGFFPVKASTGDVYSGQDNQTIMNEFASMMQYLGDYYNVTPGWAEQRTAWWTMLQHVFAGSDVEQEVKAYTKTCDESTDQALRQ